jgi:peptidyl-prolyl cis-trans isomerase C
MTLLLAAGLVACATPPEAKPTTTTTTTTALPPRMCLPLDATQSEPLSFIAAEGAPAVATVNGVRIARDAVDLEGPTRLVAEGFTELVAPLLWRQERERLGLPPCRTAPLVYGLEPDQAAVVLRAVWPMTDADLATAAERLAHDHEMQRTTFVGLAVGPSLVLEKLADELRQRSPEELSSLAFEDRSYVWGAFENYRGTPLYAEAQAARHKAEEPTSLGITVMRGPDDDASALVVLPQSPTPPVFSVERARALATTLFEPSEPDPWTAEVMDYLASTLNEAATVRTMAETKRLLAEANIVFDEGSGVTWAQLRAAMMPRQGVVAVVAGVAIDRAPIDDVGSDEKARAVADLIDNELVRRRAAAAGIVVTAAELSHELVERGLETNARDDDTLQRGLMQRALLLGKLAPKADPQQLERDALAHYRLHTDRYVVPEAIRATIASFPFDDAAGRATATAKAEAVRTAVQAGATLEATGNKPLHARASEERQLLDIYPRGALDERVEAAAFAAQPGALVGPIVMDKDVVLVRVTAKRPEHRFAFDDVKASIMRSLAAAHSEKAENELLQTLRAQATVEVHEPAIAIEDLCAGGCMGYRLVNAEASMKLTANERAKTGDGADAEFERLMQRTRARFERAGRSLSPELEIRLKENLVRKLAEEKLVAEKAKAEGLTVTPEELAAAMAERKAGFGDEQQFASFLERTTQTEADVQADLERSLLREKLIAKLFASTEPTNEDAKKYYEENLEKYQQKESIKASHILFKVEEGTSKKDKKAKLAQAQAVLVEAKQPGVDFAALAETYSEGPTKERGGDLGTFSPGRMLKPFETAAFAANAGDIIGPVETAAGYHIIKVYEKTAARRQPFDEVKASILTSLKARHKQKAARELFGTPEATAD